MEQHLEASPRLTVHAIPLPPPAGAPSPRERVLRAVSILFHSNDIDYPSRQPFIRHLHIC